MILGPAHNRPWDFLAAASGSLLAGACADSPLVEVGRPGAELRLPSPSGGARHGIVNRLAIYLRPYGAAPNFHREGVQVPVRKNWAVELRLLWGQREASSV